jgi:hypothetical protein
VNAASVTKSTRTISTEASSEPRPDFHFDGEVGFSHEMLRVEPSHRIAGVRPRKARLAQPPTNPNTAPIDVATKILNGAPVR